MSIRTMMALAVLAMLAIGLAVADGERRRMQIQVSGTQAQIDGESEDAGDESKVQVQLQLASSDSDAFRGQFEYYGRKGASQGEFHAAMRLGTITEFADTNNNSVLDAGEATYTVYRVDNVGGRRWNSFRLYNTTTAGGIVVYHLEASTVDGVLTVRAHIATAQDPATPAYNANAVKMDVDITNFNFTGPATKLNLQMRVDTSAAYEGEREGTAEPHESHHREMEMKGAAGGGFFFRWESTAQTEAGDVAVVATLPKLDGKSGSDDSYRMNFVINTVEHRMRYAWDPSIGSPAATLSSVLRALF